ncbi:effector-associated domain EAD1-containing protein [Scytonema sp. NUACC26]|uniref:effector-associated domain EAD1-containing protein n=1 Tax=Scytonema sp. NUACC26 TaxID=3140176 RepID=UPI0034DB9BBC
MELTNKQREQLKDALISAFPDKNKLEQMLDYKLDKKLNAIAGGNYLTDIVYQLIATAESEEWVEKLIRGARELNSGNSKLLLSKKKVWRSV